MIVGDLYRYCMQNPYSVLCRMMVFYWGRVVFVQYPVSFFADTEYGSELYRVRVPIPRLVREVGLGDGV